MEWKATVEQILARRRDRLGPASLEEVFTLHDVSRDEVHLSEGDRARLLDRICADPDAARQLLSLLRFPELPTDYTGEGEEEDRVESANVGQRWQAFRDHLVAIGEVDGHPGPADAEQRTDAIPFPILSQRPRLLSLAGSFLLGAFLVLAAGQLKGPTSWTNPTRDDDGIRVNLPIVELLDDGSGIQRGSGRIRLRVSAEGLVVTLTATRLTDPGPFDLRVLDPAGKDVLHDTGLEPGPGGVFVLSLPREALGDGEYQLRLERGGEPVATFTLEVTLSR